MRSPNTVAYDIHGHQHRALNDTVTQGRDTQRSLLAVRFGDGPAGPAPRGVSVAASHAAPIGISRVAVDSHLQPCRRHHGRRDRRGRLLVPCGFASLRRRPSPWDQGLGSRITMFRGLFGVHLWQRPGCSLSRRATLFHRGASADSSPPPPPRLLLAGATVARWDSHPLKIAAFHGTRSHNWYEIHLLL